MPTGTQIFSRLERIPHADPARFGSMLDDALRRHPIVFETLHQITLFDGTQRDAFLRLGRSRMLFAERRHPRDARRAFSESCRENDVLIFEEQCGPLTGEEGRCGSHSAVRSAADSGARFRRQQSASDRPADRNSRSPESSGCRTTLCRFHSVFPAFTDEEHGAQFRDDLSIASGNIVLADHGQTIAAKSPLVAVPDTEDSPAARRQCGPLS